MNKNKEIISSKVQGVELLRPGVVKISYTSNGKTLDIVYYKEEEWFTVRVNELKKGVRKKIKDKEQSIPWGKEKFIENNKSRFIKHIGVLLDKYVGKNRLRIPTKAEEARRLLEWEEQQKNKTNTSKKRELLDTLINKGTNRLKKLCKRNKKKIKDNIDPKKKEQFTNEEKKLMEVFQDKSIDEIRKIIKKEKNKPKMKKLYNKIRKTMIILGITWGLARGIWTLAKKDAKNKRVYETEQWVDQKEDAPTQTGDVWDDQREKIMLDTLQKSIPQNMLNGVEHKEIIDAVMTITNEEIQTQVIDFLKAGNIIWLQELYGMKRNSEYTSNKATGIIDQNTLKKIKNPLFGLQGEDLLNNPNISDDVKEAYQEFLNNRIPNDGLAYLILSKKTYKQYLFNKDHILINDQTILIGKDVGNNGEFIPYDHYTLSNGKFVYVRWAINTNTPTGLFKVKKIVDLGNKYKADGPPRGINIVPITVKWVEEERFKYKQWGIMIHPIYQTPGDPEKYEKAIESASIDDNGISHGCPNIKDFGIVFDQLPIGGKVYIATE